MLILAAGYASAASLGKLVPHLDWMVAGYGVSLGMAGFAVSCLMIPGALAGWTFGAIVDRIGARRGAVGGLLLSAAASLASGYAGGIGALIFCRVLEGFGYTLLVISATVIAVQLAGAVHGALALSVWSSFAPIGFALGQWAGAYASGPHVLKSIGAAHAAVLALCALAVALCIERDVSRERAPPSRAALRHAPALLASVSMGIVCAILIAAVALAPVILAAATGLSVAAVASMTALAALPSIIGRFLPGWLLGRGATALAVFSAAAALSAATVAGSLLAPVPLWLALVLFGVFQIAAGMLPGIHSAMLPHIAPAPGALGTVSGMSSQMASVGNLLGPPLVLAFYAAAGAGAAVLLLVVLLAVSIALLVGLAVFRRDLRRGAGAQAA